MIRPIHLDPASADITGITDQNEYGNDEEEPFLKIDIPNNVKTLSFYATESRAFLCDFHVEKLSGKVSPLVVFYKRAP